MAESEGLAYLRTFPDFEQGNVSASTAFGLDRVLGLLEEAGSPHLGVPVIHLAGTKGKGSTAALLAAILRAAGYHTGLFTQPHLLRIHERFMLDGMPIDDDELSQIMLEHVRPAVARLERRGLGDVQQFEAQVVLAFLWFLARGADVVVLEAGLGGRLDATNVVPLPLTTVLTPIGHDHMAVLGDTLTQIAGEKAAIIKQGVPAIAAPQPPDAAAVFVEVAAARRAPLLLGERDWWLAGVEATRAGTRFDLVVLPSALGVLGAAPPGGWETDAAGALTLTGMHTTLRGAHQAVNAAAATLAALVAASHLPKVTLDAVRNGLEAATWPGRLQEIAQHPALVLDGAHTAESAAALAQAMRTLYPGARVILVCGIQRDKDLPAIAGPLAALAAAAVCTRAHHPRAADPALVAEALRRAGCPHVEEVAEPGVALARAMALAGPEDVVLVTGSLHLVGAVLALQQEHAGGAVSA